MDHQNFGRSNGKRSSFFKENKQILLHTHHLSFRSLERQDKVKKGRLTRLLIDEEDKTFVVWVLGMQDLKLSITL
jgi:hypothetical protein